jgi:hypothetical protein
MPTQPETPIERICSLLDMVVLTMTKRGFWARLLLPDILLRPVLGQLTDLRDSFGRLAALVADGTYGGPPAPTEPGTPSAPPGGIPRPRENNPPNPAARQGPPGGPPAARARPRPPKIPPAAPAAEPAAPVARSRRPQPPRPHPSASSQARATATAPGPPTIRVRPHLAQPKPAPSHAHIVTITEYSAGPIQGLRPA